MSLLGDLIYGLVLDGALSILAARRN